MIFSLTSPFYNFWYNVSFIRMIVCVFRYLSIPPMFFFLFLLWAILIWLVLGYYSDTKSFYNFFFLSTRKCTYVRYIISTTKTFFSVVFVNSPSTTITFCWCHCCIYYLLHNLFCRRHCYIYTACLFVVSCFVYICFMFIHSCDCWIQLLSHWNIMFV